jgi:DNA-binding NtrC family response regulator
MELRKRVAELNILLVDDDAGSLRGLTLALRMLKHSCDSFTDPLAAWEEFKINLYDVVITDICMPGLNGFELGTKLRQWRPDAHIIYMSGQMSENAEAQISQDSTCIFLRKPIDFCQMKEAISQACGVAETSQTV